MSVNDSCAICNLCVMWRVAEAPQFENEWLERTRQYAPHRDRNAVNYEQRAHHRPVDNRHHQ